MKRSLLGEDDLGDPRALLADLRIRAPHAVDHGAHHLVQERPLDAEELPVARRAPEQPPEHVAAPLVRRQHAVGDEERHRAAVVGDHPERHVVALVFAVGSSPRAARRTR
jgi:hypothetical protein